MRNSQNFWDKNAGRYDRFMRKDAAAYERLYELLRPVVRHKTVLELATGTGLIAKNIVRSADHIEATDASQEMIEQAKQGVKSTKLYFRCRICSTCLMPTKALTWSSWPMRCISCRSRRRLSPKFAGC